MNQNTQPFSAATASKEPPFRAIQREMNVLLGSVAVIEIAAAGTFLVLSLTRSIWQCAVLTMLFGLSGIISVIDLTQLREERFRQTDLILWVFMVAADLLGMAVFVAGFSLPATLIFLIFSLIVTSITAHSDVDETALIVWGLFATAFISLIGTYLTGYQVALPNTDTLIPVLLTAVFMVYIALLIIQFSSAPLQIRLTTAFLAIVIVPLSIVSLALTQISLNKIQAHTFESLSSTADSVSLVFDKFIYSNQNIINTEAETPNLAQYLEASSLSPGFAALEREMKITVQSLQTSESDERQNLSSYALLNTIGLNVFDTDKANIGKFESRTEYFQQPVQTGRSYLSQIIFDQSGKGYIYFSAPIKGLNQRVLGVLRARYSALVFQRLAVNYSGLNGSNSYVILTDDNLVRIADTYKPDLVFTAMDNLPVDTVYKLQTTGRLPFVGTSLTVKPSQDLARALRLPEKSGTTLMDIESSTRAERELPEAIAYTTLSQRPWKLIYLQANYDQRPVEAAQTQTSILIATIVSLLVGLISIVASRLLANPIFTLIRTARSISAGNLATRTDLTGNDEFGVLGRTFNLMADRLAGFINELEDRVAQRTRELESRNQALVFRSRQLQTVSEVARGIVSSQELRTLLDSVTHLISSRFGFYHVGIFLLDEAREYAVLAAANSEGGTRMLARHHMLKVGRVGIVGYATGSGEARIATDVGDDAVYFNNPDLPRTRSEMALPLRVGDEIIGALDVQSTESNAFSNDDIELFATLADQVAIAIYNNRLYSETTRALSEAQDVHRQYLRQEWGKDARSRQVRGYRFTPQGTLSSEAEPLDEEPLYTAGQPETQAVEQPDGTKRITLSVPIELRGETIGVIRVQDQADNRTWTDREKLTLQEVAQQVGIALETARLFERTLQRAERERKVLEITGRIRSTNDPQAMLEIAAAELQRALGASRARISVNPQPDPTSEGNPSANPEKEVR